MVKVQSELKVVGEDASKTAVKTSRFAIEKGLAPRILTSGERQNLEANIVNRSIGVLAAEDYLGINPKKSVKDLIIGIGVGVLMGYLIRSLIIMMP